jgi:hypothetical protein
MLKDSAQDIAFAPKHKGLILAVAIADGTVIIYQWPDSTNLTSHNELRNVKVLTNGECTSLSWNPAFDEPLSLVVGCYIIKTS